MKKKLLSAFFVLAAVLPLTVFSAAAANTLPSPVVDQDDPSISSITLTEDVDLASTFVVVAHEHIVLKLDGHTITGPEKSYAIQVAEGATLEIENSETEGGVTGPWGAIENFGFVNITGGGTYTSTGETSGSYTIYNKGDMTFDEDFTGTVTRENKKDSRTTIANGDTADYNYSVSLTINNGTFTVPDPTQAAHSDRIGIKNQNGALLWINGGTFKGPDTVLQNYSFAWIYGGTFEGYVSSNYLTTLYANVGELIIYGGTFHNVMAATTEFAGDDKDSAEVGATIDIQCRGSKVTINGFLGFSDSKGGEVLPANQTKGQITAGSGVEINDVSGYGTGGLMSLSGCKVTGTISNTAVAGQTANEEGRIYLINVRDQNGKIYMPSNASGLDNGIEISNSPLLFEIDRSDEPLFDGSDITAKDLGSFVLFQYSDRRIVEGTANYIENWTQFSSVPEEQNGFYLPLRIIPGDEKAHNVTITGSKGPKAVTWPAEGDTLVIRLDDIISTEDRSFLVTIEVGDHPPYAFQEYRFSCFDVDHNYKVSFDSQGGSPVDPQLVAENRTAEKPEDPTRDGYVFAGWYRDDQFTDEYNFDTVISATTKNINLYAKWDKIPVLAFSIADAGDDLLGKKAGDLFQDGTTAAGAPGANGEIPVNVTGTALAITGWTDFSNIPGEKNGHYLPLKITPDTESSGCKLTVTGAHSKDFEKWTEDTLVMRLDDLTNNTFTITAQIGAAKTTYTIDCSNVKYGCKVTFDSQGGSAVDPQVVAENGKVKKPNDPTFTEHKFAGWYKESGCTNAWNFDTYTVAADTTLFAKWDKIPVLKKFELSTETDLYGKKASDLFQGDATDPITVSGTTVKIAGTAHYIENWKGFSSISGEENGHYLPLKMIPDAENKITISGSKESGPFVWPVAGDTLVMRLDDLKNKTFSVTIGEGDLSTTYTIDCKGVTFEHKVTFDSQGGSVVDPQPDPIANGGKVTKPADPTRDGYTFGGWYKESSCTNAWDFGKDTVTANTTLYAKWVKITPLAFSIADGDVPLFNKRASELFQSGNANTTTADDDITVKITGTASYIKDWEDFSSIESERTGHYLPLTIRLHQAIKTDCKVTITGNKGNMSIVWPAEGDTLVMRLDDLEKQTFTIEADVGGVKTTYTIDCTGVTFVYEVTFDRNDGSGKALQTVTVADGGKVTKPADPTRDGYTFKGWYDKELTKAWDFNKDTVSTDITLYAKWEKITPLAFSIAGDSDELLGKKASQLFQGKTTDTVESDYAVTVKVTGVAPYITDHTGFSSVPEEQSGHYLPLKIVPRSGEKCQVTITGSKGDKTIEWPAKGDTLIMRLDEIFKGTSKTFTVKVSVDGKDTVYTIDCSGIEFGYTVTYYIDGELFKSQAVAKGQKATPPMPSSEGSVLDGWYTDSACTQKWDNADVTEDIALYAKWVSAAGYVEVKFDRNDGSAVTTQRVPFGLNVTKPDDPTRDGYTFGGWFTESSCTNEWDFNQGVTRDMTLYAKWTSNTSSTTSGYRVTVSSSQYGYVYGSGSYQAGTEVTLTAEPYSNYLMRSIEATDGSKSIPLTRISGSKYTFTMPASDVTVKAEFAFQEVYSPEEVAPAAPVVFIPTFQLTTQYHQRPAVTFPDIQWGSWAYQPARWAYQNGYLDLADDGTFQLDGTVTHLQMWSIMSQWMGESFGNDQAIVGWARQNGAAAGDIPSGAMTRNSMIVYLYKCYFLMGGDTSSSESLAGYADNRLIAGSVNRNAWAWAVEQGIISGTLDGRLEPDRQVSRGEFAAILMRLCQK